MNPKRKPASMTGIFSQKGAAEPTSIEQKPSAMVTPPAMPAAVPVALPASPKPEAPAPSATGTPPSAAPDAAGAPGHSATETLQPTAEQKLAPTVAQTPAQPAQERAVPVALPKYVPADLTQVPTKALTVKVDLDRYRQLKTAGLDLNRSNQDIMVEALDLWLAAFSSEKQTG